MPLSSSTVLSSSLTVTGAESGLTCVSPSVDDGKHCMVLVEWINSMIPQCQLPLNFSEEELRASLRDGVIMCQLLNKLRPNFVREVDTTFQVSPYERLEEFLGVVVDLGMPGFAISDLEKGSMKPVLNCLCALKERITTHNVGLNFPRSPRSPCSPVSPESFLQNAPTQALVTVINGILDETIEKKNAKISLVREINKLEDVAQLLRKAVLEIERRISTQAEHLRAQMNLNKTKEEKYQSRIRMLESLAVGTINENEVVKNQLQQIKSERFVMEEMRKTEDKENARLEKEKDQRDVELSTLKRELKTLNSNYKEQCLNMGIESKLVKNELEQKLAKQQLLLSDVENKKKQVELNAEAKAHKQDKEFAQLKKEKDQRDLDLSTLKLELETLNRNYKELCLNMETQTKLVKNELEQKLAKQQLLLSDLEIEKKQVELSAEAKAQKQDKEVAELKKEKDQRDLELSTLKWELETLNRNYKELCLNMETQTKLVKNELEQKLAKQQLLLSDLENEKKQVELSAEAKAQKQDKEVAQLKKEKDQRDLDLSTLKWELETLNRNYKELCLNMETQTKLVKNELEQKLAKQQLLLSDLENEKKQVELSAEAKAQKQDKEVAQLKKEKDQRDLDLSTLKWELETLNRNYKEHCLNMETQTKLVKNELEQKLAKQQLLLSDLENEKKQVELSAEAKAQKWEQRVHITRSKLNEQKASLQELKNCSDSIKQDLFKTQTYYVQELNNLGEKMKTVAKAAHKYHEVSDENRKIYNELQDLKGNIRVYCRVRPFAPGEIRKNSVIEYIGDNGEMTITNPFKKMDAQKAFKFNKVFDQIASQEDVYADTQPLIRTVLDGYNVCIFAFGQTGSGKTYTMMGPECSDKNTWGVNVRALDDLFRVSEDRKDYCQYEIGVQMFEIYNEQIRDLLRSEGSQKKLGVLTNTQSKGLAVPDASVHRVQSTSDVIELMTLGHANRSVGATSMNERSSRSHSVVTVHVQGTDLISGASTRGCLHLVDLAGSERVERSEVTGDRLKEAQHINKSLSVLGDVIYALSQKSPHIPFRNSKLTQILQSYLGGGAKTLMFGQVNPDMNSYTETLSTLKFAERVSGIELGAARSNKESRDMKEIMDKVTHLKHVISKKDEEIKMLQNFKGPNNSNSASKCSVSSSRHEVLSSASTTSTDTMYSTASAMPSMYSNKSGNFSDQGSCSEHSCERQSDMASHQPPDTDERLSEVSDSDPSTGTEIDLRFEAREMLAGPKVSSKPGDFNMEKQLRSAKRLLFPRSQVAVPAISTRLTQPKSKPSPREAATALKKFTNRVSSVATPSRKLATTGKSTASPTLPGRTTINASSPAAPGRKSTSGNSSTNSTRRWT